MLNSSIVGTLLYRADGVYERVAVIDAEYFGRNGRILLLDRQFSSGMTLPDGGLLFPYTKFYGLYRAFVSEPSRILILGAGSGTVAHALYNDLPNADIDLVDIESMLFDIAHEYFMLPHSPRIHEVVADGRQFLRTNTGPYDVVVGDMYASLYSLPWHTSTREFYELLHASLAPGGVYIGNYIGTLDHTAPSALWSAVATLREVFGAVEVVAVENPKSNEVQNIMLVACRACDVHAVIGSLATSTDPLFSHFAARRVSYDVNMLAGHLVFTDDRAPVELYSAALLRRK